MPYGPRLQVSSLVIRLCSCVCAGALLYQTQTQFTRSAYKAGQCQLLRKCPHLFLYLIYLWERFKRWSDICILINAIFSHLRILPLQESTTSTNSSNAYGELLSMPHLNMMLGVMAAPDRHD